MTSYCKPQGPHQFFNEVLHNDRNDMKLKLPPKFVSIFGNELDAVVNLTTPAGRVWPVELKRDSGINAWFCDGWEEFAEHHSIIAGYLLVFGYEGNSKFRVSVFDFSGCEITYPNPFRDRDRDHGNRSPFQTKEEESADDVSYGTWGSSPPRKRPASSGNGTCDSYGDEKIHRKRSNHSGIKKVRECKHVHFKEMKKPKIEDQEESSEEHYFPNQRSSKTQGKIATKRRNENQTSFGDSHSKHRKKEHNAKARTESWERFVHGARKLNSRTPTFSAVMKPYKNSNLYVPAEFAQKYLRTGSVKLLDSSGRQWQVLCPYTRDNPTRLCKGWKQFVAENNLEEGDVCVFKLVQMEDVVLKVSIIRH